MSQDKLLKLNKIWKYAYQNFQFYSDWKIKFNLPDNIISFEEFNKWPILSRIDIQNLTFPYYIKFLPKSISGGSTGKPLVLPATWYQRFIEKRTVSYYRKKLFEKNDKRLKIILIWGHGHLFGKNLEYIFKKVKRFIFDKLYNYDRISAYEVNDLIRKNLKFKINKNKNKNILIIGYSRMMYELLIDKEVNELIISNNCRCVLTAESLLEQQKLKLFKLYKSNIVFEYGLAEFNAVAYKFQDQFYEIFENNILAQLNIDNELILTSLYSRFFPLIRYNTNDVVNLDFSETEFYKTNCYLNKISDIVGRSNDFIELYDGEQFKKIHSEYFSHALKTFPNINSFFVKQHKNKDIEIFVDATNINELDVINILNKHFKILNKISIRHEEYNKFSTGKQKFIQIEK
jgi:phenylacetate-coenzyme A ligase PaaK-like adenylate-forming protein